MPAHRVLPYKAVSARFRPFTFSQSTPIGLDRVGRRRQMRASNGESPRPTPFGGSLSRHGCRVLSRLFAVKPTRLGPSPLPLGQGVFSTGSEEGSSQGLHMQAWGRRQPSGVGALCHRDRV